MCDLHRTEISLLERSKRSPRLETIVILARGLGLKSSGELLDGVMQLRLRAAAAAAEGMRSAQPTFAIFHLPDFLDE